jgi:alpha-D-xyloside xylohydrolase
MLGPSLMVAPLFTGDTKRSVYLPKGDWYDFWTHTKYSGGRRIDIKKPAEEIPVFVNGNTLLPLADPVECVKPDTQFAVTLETYGEKPRPCVLYEDDGTTFDFEKGMQNRIEIRWEGDTGVVNKTGNYTGPTRYRIK